MRCRTIVFLTLILLLASACTADACPPDSIQYVGSASALPVSADAEAPPTAPSAIRIGGKTVEVDRVIHGPLCNDTWRGTVYVACDVQVVAWDKDGEPTFLDGCDLVIEPDTVVYVAAHNNAAYYKGCASCHATQASTANP